MKNKFYLFLTVFLFGHFVSTAQNTLTVADPRWWGGIAPGSIDEAIITVEPKGLYMEVGMYLTFSARDLWYGLEDTLEVVLDFNLPTDAIVNDSWLWVNQDIVRGKVIDRWTASAIFEEIVDRRQDPSILFKNGIDKYQLRVFPMAGTETRKVKLNFLMPTRWTKDHVFTNLPLNILNTSYAEIENFKLLVRAGQQWGNPQILHHNEVEFINVTQPGLGQWKQAVLSDIPQDLTLQFNAPLQNGIFVSTFEQGNDKIYQTAFFPQQIIHTAPPKKVMFLLDYHDSFSSLSKTAFLEQVKGQLSFHLGENDFFNIASFKNTSILQSPHWIAATPANIETVFQNLANDVGLTGNLSPLLSTGIQFIQNNNNDGEILLIGSGQQLGSIQAADPLLNFIESQLNNNIFPIHIVDFQDQNFNGHWNNNTYHQGNQYFYTNLARITNSSYLRWLDNGQDISSNISNVFQQIQQVDWSFDFYVDLENGFCYDRYNITFQGQSNYLNQPILQIGKYVGDSPFHVSLSAVLGDTTFIEEEVVVAQSEIYTADSLSQEIWVGHFLKELEASGTSPNIINQIIHESIEERVLSLYTAYLCLEPGMGGEICTDCEDDGTTTATENIDNQTFSASAAPNPFSSQTTLKVTLEAQVTKEDVQIQVYNILGQLVKTFPVNVFDIKNQQLELIWNARNEQGQTVEQGTYFFVIRVGKQTKVVKVMYF